MKSTYKYEDKEDAVLMDKRLLVLPFVQPLKESRESDDALRAELIRLGYTPPGPIVDSTRSVYLKKLHVLKQGELKSNPTQGRSKKNTQYVAYKTEIEKPLRQDGWMKNISLSEELEREVRLDFAGKMWRDGYSKTSFTYLLLDPRLTKNFPAKDGRQTHQMWKIFVNSIFYIGKGTRSRPYAHLHEAQTLWWSGFNKSADIKIQQILDIWRKKLGVVCLHVFQNIIPAEAYTYEAAMIDAIGLTNLKNLQNGTYYGITESWPEEERRMLGLYLLYKAMNIFINEGERQLRPDDI